MFGGKTHFWGLWLDLLSRPVSPEPGPVFHVLVLFPVIRLSTCQRGSGTQTKSGPVLTIGHTRAHLCSKITPGTLRAMWGTAPSPSDKQNWGVQAWNFMGTPISSTSASDLRGSMLAALRPLTWADGNAALQGLSLSRIQQDQGREP